MIDATEESARTSVTARRGLLAGNWLRRVIHRGTIRLGIQHTDTDDTAIHWPYVIPIAATLCVATGALLWFGYIATREWTASSRLVSEGRGREAAALAAAAIDADLTGAASMLLIPSNGSVLKQPPQRMLQSVARTF